MGKTAVVLVLVALVVSCLWRHTEAQQYLRLRRAFNRGLIMGALANSLTGPGQSSGKSYVVPVGLPLPAIKEKTFCNNTQINPPLA